MLATRLVITLRPAARSFTTTPTTKTAGCKASFALRQQRHIHQGTFLTQNTCQISRSRRRVDWQKTWQSSQQRGYRRGFNYSRFQQSRSLFHAWAARPTFYYEVGAIGAVFGGVYIYNLEPVPVSGRRRFNIVSPAYEAKLGEQAYAETMNQFRAQIMPEYSKEHRQVQRVVERLLPHSGLEGQAWEVHVINDGMKNAFVIPGGKVFVFRGILDICEGDDGLAAVLGHEIAHNVAHHAAERMSSQIVPWTILILASIAGFDPGIGKFLTDLAFTLPGSRSQEQEADYIGLLMMAESCYNPEAAMGLWARMERDENGAPPQFLSTHPSNHNRLEKIRGWLPEAEVKYESGDCRIAGQFIGDFKKVADFTPDFKRW